MKPFLCALALLIVFSNAAWVLAQTGRIEGKVIFEGRAMHWREQVRLTEDRLVQSDNDRFSRITSENTFTFDDIEPGGYYLASQDGEGAFVEVKPGETTRVEMVFSKKPFEIEGQLFYDRDNPKPLSESLWIEFYPVHPDRNRFFWPAPFVRSIPDKEGRFKAWFFEKGFYRARMKNSAMNLWEFIPADAVIHPVDCEVFVQIDGPDKNIRIDISQNMVTGVIVSDWTDKHPENHTIKAVSRRLPGLYSPDRVTYSVETGEYFTFDDIATGRYDLFLEANSDSQGKDPLGFQVWENIKIQEQEDSGYLQLKTEPTHALNIEAAVEGDQPVEVKYMLIRDGNLRTRRTGVLVLNDPKHPRGGGFHIAVPEDDSVLYITPPGPYRAVFAREFHVDSKRTVTGSFGDAGRLRVRLQGADISGRTIQVFSADGSRLIPRLGDPMFCTDKALLPLVILPTDPTGRTMIRGLEPGEYILRVEGGTAVTRAVVRSGETVNADLQLSD